MRRKLRTTLQTSTNNAQQSQQTNSTNSSDAVEKRVTLMVAVMIGAFLAAWTPYSITALIETFIGDDNNVTNDSMTGSDEPDGFHYYVGSISPAVATVPSLFAKTSAVLNPLIYGLLNTQVYFNNLLKKKRIKIREKFHFIVSIGMENIFVPVSRSKEKSSTQSDGDGSWPQTSSKLPDNINLLSGIWTGQCPPVNERNGFIARHFCRCCQQRRFPAGSQQFFHHRFTVNNEWELITLNCLPSYLLHQLGRSNNQI